MKDEVLLIALALLFALQINLYYIGNRVARNESREEVKILYHKIDSLTIENERINNDVLLWKSRFEANTEAD